jgi:hypothetical protein
MNWLIREKIFTYFYNKFRPVNSLYYIKCVVNKSLHNSGCCIRSMVHWTTVFFKIHSMHKEGDILQIYFCAIFRETSYHAQDVTSGTLCALSSAASKTQTAAQVGW